MGEVAVMLVNHGLGKAARFLILGSVLFVPGVSAAAEPSRSPWLTVTRKPALKLESTALEFGTLGVARNKPFELAYYAKQTFQQRDGAPRVQWTDSRSCPALKPALAALSNLTPPRVDIPGFPAPPGSEEQIVLDGVSYRLTLHQLSFSTNVGSGLADWTERTLAALTPCWRSEPPADVLPIDG